MFVISTSHNKLYTLTASLRPGPVVQCSSKTSHTVSIRYTFNTAVFSIPVFRASPSCPLRSRAILPNLLSRSCREHIDQTRSIDKTVSVAPAASAPTSQCPIFAPFIVLTLPSPRSDCDFSLLRLTKCYIQSYMYNKKLISRWDSERTTKYNRLVHSATDRRGGYVWNACLPNSVK